MLKTAMKFSFDLVRRRPLSGLLAVALATSPSFGVTADAIGRERSPAFFALAAHPGFVGYFIANDRQSGKRASGKALRLCEKSLGKGCELSMASSAAFLALGYGPDGSLNLALRRSRDEAVTALGEKCVADFGEPCQLDNEFDLSQTVAFASPVERRLYATLALGAQTEGSSYRDSRIWVAAGRASADESVLAAMKRCEAALGAGNCRYVTTSGQTHFALYRDAKGSSGGFRFHLTTQLAIASVDKICRSDGIQCEIVGLGATRDRRNQEYDLFRLRGVPLS